MLVQLMSHSNLLHSVNDYWTAYYSQGLICSLGAFLECALSWERCPPMSECRSLGQDPLMAPGQGVLLKRSLVFLLFHNWLILRCLQPLPPARSHSIWFVHFCGSLPALNPELDNGKNQVPQKRSLEHLLSEWD